MTDFSELGLAINVSSGVRMPLVPAGEDEARKDENKIESYIEYLSIDSDAGRADARARQRETIKRIRLNGPKSIDETDEMEATITQLCALGVGWHLVSPAGKFLDISFSKEKLREFLSIPGHLYIARASSNFVATAANFTKASSAS